MNLWLKLVVDQLLQVYYFTTHPIHIHLLLLSISSHATYSMMGGNELLPPLPPTTPYISLLFSIWRHAKCKWWNEQDGEFAGRWMRGQVNTLGTRAAYVLLQTVSAYITRDPNKTNFLLSPSIVGFVWSFRLIVITERPSPSPLQRPSSCPVRLSLKHI